MAQYTYVAVAPGAERRAREGRRPAAGSVRLVVIREVHVHIRARHLVAGSRIGFTVFRPPAPRRTEVLEDIAFELGVFGFRDLTRLELHLAVEQNLAQASLVVHLGIGRFRDLVEHEPEAADQERIEQEHARDAAGK